MNRDQKRLVGGGIVAAICCLAPILIVLLAGLGVSWAVGGFVGTLVLLLGAVAYAARRLWGHRTRGHHKRC